MTSAIPSHTGRRARAFISYRRADGSSFAQRLHDDLHAAHVDAWLDLCDMPSGDTFIAQIDRAIERADYFLLVATPQAVDSDYCRDEWKKALEYYKPILPLMLIGDYVDLPKEAFAYLNDARDFRDAKQYDEQLARLIEQVRIKPSPPGMSRGVPRLPSYYLPRPEILDELRDAMTMHKTTVLTSPVQKIGIQGMGGVGKSVLASAIANDYFVRRSFKDGIFWLTFGTNPRLHDIWNRLAGYLDVERNFTDSEEARDFFEEQTQDKECLIILDDLWQSHHADAFLNLGDKCRLLVTSRQARILAQLDVQTQAIDVLTDAEARFLLKQVSKRDPLPEQAKEITSACGNLPLALSMIGAMVAEKPDSYWQDALDAIREADLEDIEARFPDYPYPNLFMALKVSIDALDEDLRERYYDFAIFPEDVAIPEEVPLTFWKPVKPRKVRKVLDELVTRNLLVRLEDGSLSLHDLQLVFIRKLANNLKERHKCLLSNYNPQQTPWSSIADDGYLYNYLVRHLAAAQSHAEITKLFSNQDWMRVRFEKSNYTYTGYINDLKTASEVAQHQAVVEIKDGKEPAAFVQCLRYALIRTSINSLSSSYVPALVARAVALGLWTTQRALSVAENTSDAEKRADLYQLLLETGKLDQQEIELAQSRCIDSVFASYDTEERLVRLSRYLPQDQRQSAFHRAFSNLININVDENEDLHLSDSRIDRLIVLVPHFDDALLSLCLSIVPRLDEQFHQSRLLKTLAPFLSKDNLDVAIQISHSFADQYDQITTIAKLIQHLGQKVNLTVITLLEAADTIEDDVWRLYALSDILPLLDAEDRSIRASRMLQTVFSLPEVDLGPMDEVISSPIARALSPIASCLDNNNIDRCISHISNIQHPYAKAAVLEALLPHLNEEQKTTLKPEIAKCTEILADKLHWFFSERILATFLKYAESLILSKRRILFDRVLDRIGSSLTMDVSRKSMVNALAPHLQSMELKQYLAFLDDSGNRELREQLLTLCHMKLTQTQILEYLDQSKDTNDSGAVIAALAPLLPSIEQTRKARVIQRCFDVACTLRDVGDSFRNAEKEFEDPRNAIRELVPYMSQALLHETIQYLQNNDVFVLDHLAMTNRFKLQIAVLKYLNELDRLEVGKLVLNEILYAPLLLHPAALLIDTIPYLNPESIEKLFAHAFRRLGEGFDAVDGEILAICVPYFVNEQVQEPSSVVLKHFSSLANNPVAAQELNTLTKERLLRFALDTVISKDGSYFNIRLLSSVVPHLDNALLDYAVLSVRNNPSYHTNQILAELVPYLDENSRNTVIQNIDDPYYRATAILHVSLPRLGSDKSSLLKKALNVANSISEHDRKAEIMLRMIPHLSGKLKQQAIKAGIESANKSTGRMVWECEGVLALVPYLEYCEEKNELLSNIWSRLLQHVINISHEKRSHLLLSFSESTLLSPPVFSLDTAATMAGQLMEICWGWKWL